MVDPRVPRRFKNLSINDQNLYRDFIRTLVRQAQNFALPIIFAPRPSEGGIINGATGSVLKLDCGYFVVTASHVLEEYERRLHSGEKLNWQIGHLPPIDPMSRIAWRDSAQDTLLLRLSEDEAHGVGSAIASAPMGWPPPMPKEDEVVVVCGYPKELREVVQDGVIGANYIAAMYRVTDIRDDQFDCRIGREEDLVNLSELPLPDDDMDMGGMSGGPAFIIGGKSIIFLVLVGVISKLISKSFDGFRCLRIAALKNASGL